MSAVGDLSGKKSHVGARPELYFAYILMAVVFQALSGIMAKYASSALHSYDILSLTTNVFYLLSIGFLVLQAIVWQLALKRYELSFAYPFISLVNFIILFSSYALFGESITPANIAGLLLISFGVFLLSREGVKA
jgi:drug/metabolite transporter (DMT)-like permease